MAIRFVVSIEDKAYFHWQLSIFLESLVDQLPDGSGIDVVVCNDYATLSPDLATVFTTYGDAVRYLPGTNYGRRRIEVQSEDDAVGYRVGASASHAYLDVLWRTNPRSYIALESGGSPQRRRGQPRVGHDRADGSGHLPLRTAQPVAPPGPQQPPGEFKYRGHAVLPAGRGREGSVAARATASLAV